MPSTSACRVRDYASLRAKATSCRPRRRAHGRLTRLPRRRCRRTIPGRAAHQPRRHSSAANAGAGASGVPAELSALLASPLPRAGLPIRVQAVPFRGSGRKAAVRLVVEVLGRSLAFAERSGRFVERIDLALLTVDDRARAGNGRSATIDVRLTPDELQRVKATGVRWLAQLDLEPGRYQVRVAARALGTAASGTITCDVDVPAFEPDRLAMSGVTMTSLPSVLMLTRGEQWLQTTIETPPSAARSFVAGDELTGGGRSLRARDRRRPKSRSPRASSGPTARTRRSPARRLRAETENRAPKRSGFPSTRRCSRPDDTCSISCWIPRDARTRVERRVPFEVLPKS